MRKPYIVVSCPADTFSGYGARSRDVLWALIESGKYDVQIMSQRWGNTPWNFIEDKTDWCHLDIAGPARAVDTTTGYGVRLITSYLEKN